MAALILLKYHRGYMHKAQMLYAQMAEDICRKKSKIVGKSAKLL